MLDRLHDPTPHARLLSNGRYAVLLTGAGAGASTWGERALTVWSADRTEDRDGLFVYLRDLDRGHVWSAGHQPVGRRADAYAAEWTPGRMTITRTDDGIEAALAVAVAPDADVELRRLHLRNRSRRARRIELTTYAEVALAPRAAHAAHPAFSRLFVETEHPPGTAALLARRRPRSHDEDVPWMVHALGGGCPVEHETDRTRFVGRGRSLALPRALASAAPLSGTTGSVLDPVLSLRRVVSLAPGGSASLALALGGAASREAALGLVARLDDPAALDAAFEGAAARARALLDRLRLPEERAEYLQDLAGAMLYGHPALGADAGVLARARGGRTHLGRLGFGARPLVVCELETTARLPLVGELVQARAYWAAEGLPVDLLIVCGGAAAVADAATRETAAAGEAGGGRLVVGRRGEIPAADLDLLRASAQLLVRDGLPALASEGRAPRPRRGAARPAAAEPSEGSVAPGEALLFDNGHGGFTSDGAEYVIRVPAGGERPPMPWVNVLANEGFGCLASESGAACTWSRNSRENRLTPWYNDPVGDPHGEALYVRDDAARVYWSPQPGPVPPGVPVEVRHGLGASRWRLASHDLVQEVELFVPPQDPVRVLRVRLTNTRGRTRRVSVFAYHRLVLGPIHPDAGRTVVTEIDAATGAVLARNGVRDDSADGIAFAAAVAPEGAEVQASADRTAFLGRHGSPAAPAAVAAGRLEPAAGIGLDPCAALQVTLRIPPRATVECAFLLGEVRESARLATLLGRWRRPGAVEEALGETRAFWHRTLGAVRVETPVPALDVMLNGWLLYQAIACRLWGRSGFYQSGGAFGFRDQLQDAAALVWTRPDLLRAQIVLHAGHQFVEGDVLHWWHPPGGRGIRTRFSDDLLWLPWVTAGYVRATGDRDVLDEPAPFLAARALAPGEDEAFLEPVASGETADLYAHCCRAIDRSLAVGAHGLPLMGTGDWNDGMNRVGREGRGESVWMAFFLFRVLEDFAPLCEVRGDAARAARYRAHQSALRTAVEAAGWDGEWYRRAYYDDGTPLGTAAAAECRIDALAQAWAVLSGAVPPARAAQAMDAVERLLVSREAGIIRLLTPPFDRDPHDPGYIKGYVPGIRENGGQYTHAALWVVQAFAALDRRDRAAAYLEMLGPVAHAGSAEAVAAYQVEPYVVAADVYGEPPHVGRGGWTWYTGSAGWMYRVGLEAVLGLRLEGETLVVKPCVPTEWPGFRVVLALGDGRTSYEVVVTNGAGAVSAVSVDGTAGQVEDGAARVALVRDGGRHRVEVTLGSRVR
jgi:cellobiose phosphorylase